MVFILRKHRQVDGETPVQGGVIVRERHDSRAHFRDDLEGALSIAVNRRPQPCHHHLVCNYRMRVMTNVSLELVARFRGRALPPDAHRHEERRRDRYGDPAEYCEPSIRTKYTPPAQW